MQISPDGIDDIKAAAALLGVAALLFGPFASAHAAEKRYGLTQFHSVEILTDADVELVSRGPVSAVAVGPQSALDRLVVEVRDGRLKISMRQYAGDDVRRKGAAPLRIQINAHRVRELQLLGSGRASLDQLIGQRMKLSLRGTGTIEVARISGDALAVEMMGQGQMQLAGQVKQAEMRLIGDVRLAAEGLTAQDAAIEANGSGTQSLSVSKRANVALRGAGRVEILGAPACTVRNMGLGTVICGK